MTRWEKMTIEQRAKHNLRKKKVDVICSDCGLNYLKRKDSLKNWVSLCRKCCNKEVANRPKIKFLKSKNAREQVLKQGGIPNARHFSTENHSGMKHCNWGKFRELHPHWIKDRSKLKIKEDRRGARNMFWVEDCKKRDGYKCKIANKDCNGKLEVHHILPWRKYPELRHDINNGITLCSFHHPRKHAEEERLSPYFKQLVSKPQI